jgi:hypothetical protein
MPSLVASTVVTLAALSSPPASTQPFDLPGLRLPEKFFDLTVAQPINEIKPYGPSFQFNGLTVYVEPIGVTSRATTQMNPAVEIRPTIINRP